MASVRTSVPGSGYGSAYVDALIWGGVAWDPSSGPITYHFGEASDLDSASQVHHGDAIASVISLQDRPLDPWTSTEKDAFRYATDLYSSVSGLRFQEVDSVTDANMVWWQAPLNDEGLLGIHEIPTTEAPQIWGAFNSSATFSWSYLAPGGSGLNTIIHELGHGVGLAHPHDGGGDPSATVFPGVSWPGDTGDRRLNQGLATIMSYNDGYDRAARSGPFGG